MVLFHFIKKNIHLKSILFFVFSSFNAIFLKSKTLNSCLMLIYQREFLSHFLGHQMENRCLKKFGFSIDVDLWKCF